MGHASNGEAAACRVWTHGPWPMILLRGAQIVHFGSLCGEEWDIVIAA